MLKASIKRQLWTSDLYQTKEHETEGDGDLKINEKL